MDIKHQFGKDMEIILNSDDIKKLERHNIVSQNQNAEGRPLLNTTVVRGMGTEAVAEVNGLDVTVYLPKKVILPLQARLIEPPAADPAERLFMFGDAGRVILIGQVQIG